MGKKLNNDPEKRPVTLVVRAPDDTLFQKEYALCLIQRGGSRNFKNGRNKEESKSKMNIKFIQCFWKVQKQFHTL